MDRFFALASFTTTGVGRIVLIYYFLSLLNTPILLCVLLSASLALFGGFQAWMCSPNPTNEGGGRLSFELVAYNAMEVLLLVLSVNQKSLMGQVLVQVCPIQLNLAFWPNTAILPYAFSSTVIILLVLFNLLT